MNDDVYTEAGEEFDRRLDEDTPTLGALMDDGTRSRYRVWFRAGAVWAEYRLGGEMMHALYMSVGMTVGIAFGMVLMSDWVDRLPLSWIWISIVAFSLTSWVPPRLVRLTRRFVDWRVERATRPRT